MAYRKKNARSDICLERERHTRYISACPCLAFSASTFSMLFHSTIIWVSLLLSVIVFTPIMITLLPDHFVEQPVSVNDLQIASLAWGFTIGFGFLTVWTAIKQTADVQRRYGYWKLNSPYIWMIWLEILVCLMFSIICWLHLNDVIPPRYLLCMRLAIFIHTLRTTGANV